MTAAAVTIQTVMLIDCSCGYHETIIDPDDDAIPDECPRCGTAVKYR